MRAYRACLAGLLSLGLFLSACDDGGGDGSTPVTPLPDTVTISGTASVDTDDSAQFGSDIANTDGGLSFHWDFGDGASSAEAAPTHRFVTPGQYDVVLTVSNEDGAAKSATFKVTAAHYAMVRDLKCSGADHRGWCWQRPQPTGNDIEDISFIDASTGWAVGDAGQILKTTDGGVSWVNQASHVTERLTLVRFATATVGWVLGYNGTILKTTDAGATWLRQAALTDYPYQPQGLGLVVLDESRVLTVPGGSVSVTLDGGQTWLPGQLRDPNQVTSDGTAWEVDSYQLHKSTHLGVDEPTVSFDGYLNRKYLYQFTMGNTQTGLMTAYDWDSDAVQLLRTANAGASWKQITPVGLPTLSGVRLKLFGAKTAWVVAPDEGLFRSVDTGSTWQAIPLPADANSYQLWDAHPHDGQTLWFKHGTGYYLTTDAGAHWTWLHVESEWLDPDKLSMNAGGLWLQYRARIYHSQDGGASWSQAFGTPVSESPSDLSAVWFFDAKKGLAVGTGGWLLETGNGGRSWSRKALTGNDSFIYSKLQFVSPTTGWMSGAWGISKTNDGGATWWTPVIADGLTDANDFHFTDAMNGWAIARSQALFSTVDGGETWQEQTNFGFGPQAIRFLNAQVGVIAGRDGTIMRTEDGGENWNTSPTGLSETLHRVVFVGSTGWAVGDQGAVVKSSDAGLTWNRVQVPASRGLRDVTFTDALHGWIVGDNGAVLATPDGGVSWGVQASGTTHALYGAFFLDAYTGWIAGSDGAVLATATAGR